MCADFKSPLSSSFLFSRTSSTKATNNKISPSTIK
jgi:hypothetical protein